MKIDELMTVLRGSSIVDIWLAGYLDAGDTRVRFYPRLSTYFIETTSALLRLSVRESEGEGLVSVVPEITRDFDLDDAVTFAVMSAGEMKLRQPFSPARIYRAEVWGAVGTEAGVEWQAIRFDLDLGQVLFFDPSHYFGIRVGGTDDQEEWNEHIGERRKASVVFDFRST